MADPTAVADDELFAELYGTEAPAEEAPPPDQQQQQEPLQLAPPAPPAAGGSLADDAAAIYGGEAVEVDFGEDEPMVGTATAEVGAAAEQQAAAAVSATGGENSDDDLVIALDENAASYEPTAGSRFQYQRQAPLPAATAAQQQPEAVGAAPGQHVDVAAEAPPALPGFGGLASRTAIGGIPRSAIPGLAGSSITSVPVGAVGGPAAGAAAAAAGAAAPSFRGGGLPGRAAMADAVFPSQWSPGLSIKLPGQTRASLGPRGRAAADDDERPAPLAP